MVYRYAKHLYCNRRNTGACAPHFAICAPAYGQVGRRITRQLAKHIARQPNLAAWSTHLIPTKMAGRPAPKVRRQLAELGYTGNLETNADLHSLAHCLLESPSTGCIVMAAAICDFEPDAMQVHADWVEASQTSAFGKDQPRLHHAQLVTLRLRSSEKIVASIKAQRPDILLVSFKTTAGCSQRELARQAAENAQKTASDLVFANDLHTRQNLVVQPDGQYRLGASRSEALAWLCASIAERLASA